MGRDRGVPHHQPNRRTFLLGAVGLGAGAGAVGALFSRFKAWARA